MSLRKSDGFPQISVVPVRFGSDRSNSYVPGSVVDHHEKCKRCTEHWCVVGREDGVSTCPWGLHYQRLDGELIAFGFLLRRDTKTDLESTRRMRKAARQTNAPLIDSDAYERSIRQLKAYLSGRSDQVEREIGAAKERVLLQVTPAAVLKEFRDEVRLGASANHDNIKVAAGIRASVDRLLKKHAFLKEEQSFIAIDGMARRLESIAGLHQLLHDPSSIDRMKDVSSRRFYATIDTWHHYLEPVALERGVKFPKPKCRQGNSIAQVMASDRLLGGIVLQVLDNAIGFSVAGDSISCAIDDNTDRGEVSLVVENFGPRVEPDEWHKLRKPFYRGIHARAAKEGSGVGLAVVDIVVTHMRGRLDIRQAGDGPRPLTTVEITLPTFTP